MIRVVRRAHKSGAFQLFLPRMRRRLTSKSDGRWMSGVIHDTNNKPGTPATEIPGYCEIIGRDIKRSGRTRLPRERLGNDREIRSARQAANCPLPGAN